MAQRKGPVFSRQYCQGRRRGGDRQTVSEGGKKEKQAHQGKAWVTGGDRASLVSSGQGQGRPAHTCLVNHALLLPGEEHARVGSAAVAAWSGGRGARSPCVPQLAAEGMRTALRDQCREGRGARAQQGRGVPGLGGCGQREVEAQGGRPQCRDEGRREATATSCRRGTWRARGGGTPSCRRADCKW